VGIAFNKLTAIQLPDNASRSWTLDAAVEVHHPGPAPYLSSATERGIFKNPYVTVGQALPMSSKILEVDLITETQSIEVTIYGNGENLSLSRAIGTAPAALSAPPSTTPIPAGSPPYATFLLTTGKNYIHGGGTYIVNASLNRTGYWDSWGNLWST
jgi:hypothetical protein